MAKPRNRQNQSNQFEENDEMTETGTARQGRRSEGARGSTGRNTEARSARSERGEGSNDLMGSIGPVITDARRFIDGHPARAAALGALIGGVLMTLLATDRGRSVLRTGLSYANPVISKYARDFAGRIAGDLSESALLQ